MSFEAYRWLLLWLQPVNEYIPIEIDNYTYFIEKQFRIAFNIYTIFRNTTTNEYIWYVIQNNYFNKYEFLRSKKYITYNSLLIDIANQFFHKWKDTYQNK